MNRSARFVKLMVYLQAAFALLCLAAICALPVSMLQDGITEFNQWRYLSEDGVETNGIILEIGPDPGKGLREVEYQYEVNNADGTTSIYVVSKDVAGPFAARLTIGQPVPVLYDPDSPSVSRLKADYQFFWDLTFIPGVIALGAIGLAVQYLVRRVRC